MTAKRTPPHSIGYHQRGRDHFYLRQCATKKPQERTVQAQQYEELPDKINRALRMK